MRKLEKQILIDEYLDARTELWSTWFVERAVCRNNSRVCKSKETAHFDYMMANSRLHEIEDIIEYLGIKIENGIEETAKEDAKKIVKNYYGIDLSVSPLV